LPSPDRVGARVHRDRVAGYVDSALAEGAEVVVDGRGVTVAGGEDGFFFGPTLVDRVTPEMAVYRDEIFGPVLSVLRVDSLDEALAEAMEERNADFRLRALTVVHFAAGRRRESDEALRELRANHAETSAYQIAEAHAARGEPDAAFEWLERAFAQRDAGMFALKALPRFRSLHADTRWGALLARLGLAG